MIITYRFGRVNCSKKTYLAEGKIINDENKISAFKSLDINRLYKMVEWNPHVCAKELFPTEETADEIIYYLEQNFKKNFKFGGLLPDIYMHGRIHFDKICKLEVSFSEYTALKEKLKNFLGSDLEPILTKT